MRRWPDGEAGIPFSLYSGLQPEKWVRASARKKVFGSRSRQAKRSACPTEGG